MTDVQKLIMTADKGNSNSDDCIDWADAKIYMKSEVQEPLDTDILEYMIEIASTADTSGVIDTVVQKFNEAYASAQDILEKAKAGDPSITQDMVDSSWQELMSIMHYLSFKQGDKTDLEKVITMAEELDLDRYLAAGKDAFEAALTNAQNVMGDGDAMQDEVDQAWKELLRAMSELRLKPDKSALEDLISQAQGLNAEDYEAESFSAMLSVLRCRRSMTTRRQHRKRLRQRSQNCRRRWISWRQKPTMRRNRMTHRKPILRQTRIPQRKRMTASRRTTGRTRQVAARQETAAPYRLKIPKHL